MLCHTMAPSQKCIHFSYHAYNPGFQRRSLGVRHGPDSRHVSWIPGSSAMCLNCVCWWLPTPVAYNTSGGAPSAGGTLYGITYSSTLYPTSCSKQHLRSQLLSEGMGRGEGFLFLFFFISIGYLPNGGLPAYLSRGLLGRIDEALCCQESLLQYPWISHVSGETCWGGRNVIILSVVSHRHM